MAVYIEKKRRATYGGLHDLNKAYNPYVIVLADDNYYLSVSPVPTGIPITDKSYWMWYAGAAGDPALALRIEKLETDMDHVENLIDGIEDNIINMSGSIMQIAGWQDIMSGSIMQIAGRQDIMSGSIMQIAGRQDIMSGSIMQIAGRVTDLEARMTRAETDIAGLINSVNYAATDVSNINTDTIKFTQMMIGG